MNCSNHGEREAVGMCVRCHKLICEECKVKINNKYYCKECVSEMYSDNNSNNNYYNNGSTINSDKFKEYADKAANAAFEVTDKISQNKKIANYVLGIIAIILLLPKVINNISSIPYFFEELIFSSRYYGLFSTMFYIIEFALSFIEPIIIIALASLLFNNFMKLKKQIRIIAPIVVVIAFTLIRFVSASISSSYYGFNIIISMFSYFVPVILIVIGSYLDN
ncbi:MAG: B-box zinc finger protein [Clostridium celatum]|nr:B-box zinc finger protein [Clostridium celatum]